MSDCLYVWIIKVTEGLAAVTQSGVASNVPHPCPASERPRFPTTTLGDIFYVALSLIWGGWRGLLVCESLILNEDGDSFWSSTLQSGGFKVIITG